MLRLETHSQPPQPPHLEALIERQGKEGVRDHFHICQDVRLELERAARDGEALPGTPICDIVHLILSMVAPAVGYPVYPYRRPRGHQLCSRCLQCF
jgi:hypothetical protein